MRSFNSTLICLVAGALISGGGPAAQAVTTTVDFERYQKNIVDRKPFGEAAPPETAAAPAVPTSEIANKDLEMKAIIEDESGIRAGFLNKKTNKTFFLGVGEKLEGYELVSVNYENEEAVMRKGLESSVFVLHPKKDSSTNAVPGLGSPMPMPPGTFPATAAAPAIPRPLFSDLKKKKMTTPPANLKPGSAMGMPFRGETIESFLKEHPEAVLQFPNPVRPPDPSQKSEGMGETIERFLKSNPDAMRQFSPFKPVSTIKPDAAATPPGLVPAATVPLPQPQPTEPTPTPAPETEVYEEYYTE